MIWYNISAHLEEINMTMTVNKTKHDHIILCTIDELVPADHMVRKLEASIDWCFIYPLVENLYSRFGRASIDPVVLFKMIFINIIFGINSMRRTCREIEVNLAYRWFLGLSIKEKVPNYSTWSQNYIRRYSNSEVFEQIFVKILSEAMNCGFVDLDTVFCDSTHQKANANKNKYTDEEAEIVKKAYEDELLKEVNEDRVNHGKKPLKDIEREELEFDEKTGEIKKNVDTKHIKQSKTDPESGCFHKGEKEKCFAYSHQTFCDRNGFVLSVTTVPGNIHDSVSFFEAYKKLKKLMGGTIKGVCLDGGYKTPAVCKVLLEDGMNVYMPYKRPMTKKGFFKKYEYVYDEYYDCYICPNNKIIKYSTTNKKGYREYKSNPKDCRECPLRNKCTESKNMTKVVMRHVWAGYVEEVEEIRYTDKWKEIYRIRKESIERVFGECKEKHNLRFTRLRGLRKNKHQGELIFACHNLRKMAGWLWKDRPVFIKKGNKSEIYKEKEINNKSKTKKGGIRTLKLVFIPSFVNSLEGVSLFSFVNSCAIM